MLTNTVQVAIYQITDKGLCNKLLDLHNDGVDVSIIVSARIVSYTDWRLAQDCYGLLYNNGMKGKIRKALTKFSFAHQKYWIIDNTAVHLSTGTVQKFYNTPPKILVMHISGNWSPSDFPEGNTFKPYSKTSQNINRDILVSMEGSDIVGVFQDTFKHDWESGTDWYPKN